MASLTTVYMISIILTSIAGMSSAFVGNSIYPLTGGADEKPEVQADLESTPSAEPLPETQAEETLEPLEETIKNEFNMDDEFARNVIAFIKTPVTEWKTIAADDRELKKKFRNTLTHPNLNKCPARLLDVCKIVNIKFVNMIDLINDKSYTPYGDQTADALAVLSGNQ
jgi:hypothetical protein